MSRPAHPGAMQPSKPGRTRTAPPQLPPEFPTSGRYRSYTLFGLTGILYLLLGFVALRAIWALGSGEPAWTEMQSQLAHPAYIAFHLLSFAGVLFVGVRFFRLFPKAQPAHLGPIKPPPAGILHTGLYLAWMVVAGGFALVLSGGIF